MCYKSPGPRCSNHAKQKMDNALALLNTQREILKSFDDEHPELDSLDLRIKRKGLSRNLQSTIRRHLLAKEEWISTPGGLKELSLKYKNLVKEGKTDEANRVKAQWQYGYNKRQEAFYKMKEAEKVYQNNQKLRGFIEELQPEDRKKLIYTFSGNVGDSVVGAAFQISQNSEKTSILQLVDKMGLKDQVSIEFIKEDFKQL